MRNSAFEAIVRKLHGNRYSFEQDVDGYYTREVVKRMYEIYCICTGILK